MNENEERKESTEGRRLLNDEHRSSREWLPVFGCQVGWTARKIKLGNDTRSNSEANERAVVAEPQKTSGRQKTISALQDRGSVHVSSEHRDESQDREIGFSEEKRSKSLQESVGKGWESR